MHSPQIRTNRFRPKNRPYRRARQHVRTPRCREPARRLQCPRSSCTLEFRAPLPLFLCETPLPQRSLYEFIKLGMNLQHLRSIASVSIIPATSLVAFPNLEENQPGVRCSVRKTVELIKSVRI